MVYTTIRTTDKIHKGKKGKETEKMSAKKTTEVKEEKALEFEGQEQVRLVDYVAEAESSPSPATDAAIETSEAPGQKSQLFMVRMWPEPLGTGKVEWRGQVNHVASGEGYPFRDWSRLIVCLEQMLQPGFRTGHGIG